MGTSLPAPGAVPIQQKIVKRSAARSPGAKKTARFEPSPYGCYLASRPYSEEVRFRSIYLRFPKGIVKRAGEETERLTFRLRAVRKGRTDTTGVRYAHCVMPEAKGAKEITLRQVVREGENQAVLRSLKRSSKQATGSDKGLAKGCDPMKVVIICVDGSCEVKDIILNDCDGDGGGDSGGGSDNRCDSYPCEGSGPSGGGEFGDSGDDGEDCEQIVNPLPGSSCAPAEPEVNPCESDNPPEWCEIGCKLSAAELVDGYYLYDQASEGAKKTFINTLEEHGDSYGLDSEEDVRHFIAQTAHESQGAITKVENLNYQDAENLAATFLAFTSDGKGNTYKASEYVSKPREIAEIVYSGRLGN